MDLVTPTITKILQNVDGTEVTVTPLMQNIPAALHIIQIELEMEIVSTTVPTTRKHINGTEVTAPPPRLN